MDWFLLPVADVVILAHDTALFWLPRVSHTVITGYIARRSRALISASLRFRRESQTPHLWRIPSSVPATLTLTVAAKNVADVFLRR